MTHHEEWMREQSEIWRQWIASVQRFTSETDERRAWDLAREVERGASEAVMARISSLPLIRLEVQRAMLAMVPTRVTEETMRAFAGSLNESTEPIFPGVLHGVESLKTGDV